MKLRSSGLLGFVFRMTLAAIVLGVCYTFLHGLMPGQTLRLVIIHAAAFVVILNATVPKDGLLPRWMTGKGLADAKESADIADETDATESPSAISDEDAVLPSADESETLGDGRSARTRVHEHERSQPIVYEMPSFEDGDDLFQPADWHLKLIYDARQNGSRRALLQLGEVALQRGMLVEAYYWMSLAEIRGVRNLTTTLRQLRVRWMKVGSPTEYDNIYEGFSKEQGDFARALLRIQCGVLAPLARLRMTRLAAEGSEEARLYLAHRTRRGPKSR